MGGVEAVYQNKMFLESHLVSVNEADPPTTESFSIIFRMFAFSWGKHPTRPLACRPSPLVSPKKGARAGVGVGTSRGGRESPD